MITCLINGNGVAEFTYSILQHYKSSFNARLPADINVKKGDIITLDFMSAIGLTEVPMEVIDYSDAGGSGRWHIFLMPLGTKILIQNCVPQYIKKPNSIKVINACYAQYGQVGNYKITTQPIWIADNISIPGSISNFKALSRYFGSDIGHEFDGTLRIGDPIPTPNLGQFNFINYNGNSRTIEVGFGNSDFIINPGDIIFQTAIVKNVIYKSGVNDLRAQIKITDESPDPVIISPAII
jgi:hypothetical protein